MYRPHRTIAPLAALPLLAAGALLLPAAVGADTRLPEATERIPGSDLWNEARLQTAYTLNEHLSAQAIQISSDQGRVTLTGQVPTEAQRRLAGQLARELVSARSIDNQLAVRPGMRGDADNRLYRAVQDANITTRIELQLLWSRDTSGDAITAYTNDGEVRLGGRVASAAERQDAERIARRTEGVRSVTNEIQVKPDAGKTAASDRHRDDQAAGRVADDRLSDRVASTLRFTSDVKDGRIRVEARDGVVSLTGRVASAAQKRQAADIAGSLEGVRDVHNALSVQQPA